MAKIVQIMMSSVADRYKDSLLGLGDNGIVYRADHETGEWGSITKPIEEETCIWIDEKGNHYQTGCGKTAQHIHRNFPYCPYCTGKIVDSEGKKFKTLKRQDGETQADFLVRLLIVAINKEWESDDGEEK